MIPAVGVNANSTTQPVLRTERLVLRPFDEDDAPRLRKLAGARRIADTMISVPHPYPAGRAPKDIRHFQEDWQSGTSAHFAITLAKSTTEFVGYVAIKHIDREHQKGELSFWIDEAAGGKGYITEAGRAALSYAFDQLDLNRICAYSMVRNPGSGRVLTKLGFTQEGCMRQCVRKWGVFEDVLLWAVLREDDRV